MFEVEVVLVGSGRHSYWSISLVMQATEPKLNIVRITDRGECRIQMECRKACLTRFVSSLESGLVSSGLYP